MVTGLFDYLPTDRIIAAFERSPGNELGSGKLENPESSAALAANSFGFFMDRPRDLPPIPGTEGCGWPAESVSIEECVRFPWRGGRHPWLDAFVETATHIIGIESKRYEPFRTKSPGSFSDAYWRPVWGDEMQPFEWMRDAISKGEAEFHRLDAVQLVKHAFGLRTEAHRRNKRAWLVCLYAEPTSWPDGKHVNEDRIAEHAEDIRRFADVVAGAEVGFSVAASLAPFPFAVTAKALHWPTSPTARRLESGCTWIEHLSISEETEFGFCVPAVTAGWVSCMAASGSGAATVTTFATSRSGSLSRSVPFREFNVFVSSWAAPPTSYSHLRPGHVICITELIIGWSGRKLQPCRHIVLLGSNRAEYFRYGNRHCTFAPALDKMRTFE